MKIIAITQARTSSTRLPSKVLKEINGKTLLEIHIERILKAKRINKLIIATTIDQEDDIIVQLADKMNVPTYRGSLSNVLSRYYYAAKPYCPDYIVRLTSDCPLIDSELMDKIIQNTIDKNLDYGSNTLDPNYPDGQDIEVFKFKALEKAFNYATLQSDKEHVTPYIWRNSSFHNGTPFISENYNDTLKNWSKIRMTVDQIEDFEMIKCLIEQMGTNKTWLEYADYIESKKELHLLNANINRNEGYCKSIKDE